MTTYYRNQICTAKLAKTVKTAITHFIFRIKMNELQE